MAVSRPNAWGISAARQSLDWDSKPRQRMGPGVPLPCGKRTNGRDGFSGSCGSVSNGPHVAL